MSDNFRLLASFSGYDGIDDIDYKTRAMETFQSKVNRKFDQSTSTTSIQEEYPYGSGEFRGLVCRVTSVRTVGTGSKMSDSYKSLIFKDQSHSKNVGYLYKFENNYWIACNSDIMSSPTDSVVVRRCNNVLKWKDDNGKIQSVPISFEEDAFYLTNSIQQEVDRSNGYRRAIIQRTALTNTIKPNQRFIFGNQCLKISGSGISSFLNQETYNNDSPAIIRLTFEYDYINPEIDDVENKIANAFSNNYSISIDQKDTEYSVTSNENIFSATIFNNDMVEVQDLDWSVVSASPYTISQSDNKLKIIFGGSGNYTINVVSKLNSSLRDSINIVVKTEDKYLIQCSPIMDTILKGDTASFTFDIYKNGIKANDGIFLFEKIDTLSSDYYSYSINNNIITITNKKMSNTKINIRCSITNYDLATPYILNLKLGGAW